MNHNSVSLFAWIRSRHRAWSAGVVMLLLGGWLSALCQQCLAYADHTGNADNGHVTHTEEHCPPGLDQQSNVPDVDHCSSDCDCTTAAAVPEKYQNLQVVVSVVSFDNHFTFQTTESGLYRKAWGEPPPGLYRNPDHSRLLPYEHFRILLI